MVDRVDPARTGVKAGRVVGLLTAALAVYSLVRRQGTFYDVTELFLEVAGVEATLSITALFWGNVVVAATTRYAVCYVVGSLVGVVYDWLDRPSLVVLTAMVVVVGFVDGTLAGLEARSVVIGGGYLLAWLAYVPVFAWLFDEEGEDVESGPRRLGEM